MDGPAQAESLRKRRRGESNADEPPQDQIVLKGAAQAEDSRKRARNESEINEPYQDFVYSPLNHQAPSIRLVRILEDLSPEGCIQCDVRHASTSSSYVCLSYVWGGTEPGQWILLNGRRVWIRDNLGQFLQCARHKAHIQREWLWIDALSINQDDNTERSHQVQQMGEIYSNATKVISWFGMDAGIEGYLRCVASGGLFSLQDGSHFHYSDYWKRAWITQEFALAQQSTFMAGMADVESERVPYFETDHNTPQFDRIDLGIIARINHERSELKGQRLFHLLETLRNKQCSNPRDRIFSLLALCSDCPHLTVDYDIPAQDLALRILTSSERSICFCTTRFLDDLLQAPRVVNGQQLPCTDTSFASTTTTDDATPIAPHPGYKEFWIPISLGMFCSKSSGYISLHITSASSTFFDSGVDAITYSWYAQGVSSPSARGRVHGCTIQIASGRDACTLMFSWGMFLEMALMSRQTGRHRCCSRVTVSQVGEANAPAIRVYQKQVRMEMRMDFRGVGWQRGNQSRTERRRQSGR